MRAHTHHDTTPHPKQFQGETGPPLSVVKIISRCRSLSMSLNPCVDSKRAQAKLYETRAMTTATAIAV